MTEVIKVLQERTVVVRGETAVKIIHSGFQGLPGPRGLPGEGAALVMKAGIDLGGHRLVTPSEDGLVYADYNTPDTAMRICGITTGAATAGEDVQVKNSGEVTESTWNWDVTKPVYLGPNGVLTQVNPRAAGAAFSLVVGFPSTPKTLFINIREPIFL